LKNNLNLVFWEKIVKIKKEKTQNLKNLLLPVLVWNRLPTELKLLRRDNIHRVTMT